MLKAFKKYNRAINLTLLTLTAINLLTNIFLFKTNAEKNGDIDKSIIERPTLETAFNNENITNVISSGYNYTLAIKSDGTVWSWGINDYGQLGNGSIDNSNTPIQVSSLTDTVAVSAGYHHSLALKPDGTLWAWGSNKSGQLGNETTDNSSTPVQVKDLIDVVTMSSGYNYSLAIKSDGTVWSWGTNDYGQLGDGTNNNRKTPVQVSNLTDIVAVSAGYNHSLALKYDGTVWSWGANEHGKLGNGTNENSNIPVQIKDFNDVLAISVFRNHSLALKPDGALWAWGHNGYGRLGDGTTENKNTPVQVKNLTNAKIISAGDGHSLALDFNEMIWAWGDNKHGQLGDKTVVTSIRPIKTNELTDILTVDAGNNHSLALKPDGTLWAWGVNSSGQLGDGTINKKTSPVQIEDFKLWDLKVEIENNPIEWINEDISLTIKLKDNRGSDEIILPDKSSIIGTTANYIVNQNGEYTFKVKDLSGVEVEEKVIVEKIDKEKPTTPVLVVTEDNRLDIKPGKDNLSGIREHLYKIDDSQWTNLFSIENLEDGTYSLSIKALDNAGNSSDIAFIKFVKKGKEIQELDSTINEINLKLDSVQTKLISLKDNIVQDQIQYIQDELDEIKNSINILLDDGVKEELNNKLKALQKQLYEVIKIIEIAKEAKIKPRKLTLNIGAEEQLIYNCGMKASWKSSNEDIIRVSDEGLIKAVSSGNATITVTIDNTDIIDSIVVYAIKKPSSSETDDSSTVTPVDPIDPIKPENTENSNEPEEPVRLNGKDRIDAAIEMSKKTYKDGESKVAVLVGSDGEADVSSGTALAKAEDAPMLITYKNKLDEELLTELKRLGVEKTFILGGNKTIDEAVETELYNKGYCVKRLAGDNRNETAIEIARYVYKDKSSTEAFIVQHNSLADALAIGSVAAIKNAPVLLTKTNVVPHTTIKILEDLNIKKITIVGGSTIVSNKITDMLPKDIDIDRIGGANRAETTLLIAEKYFKDSKTAIITNGYSYKDSMVGGYFAVKENAPILFTKTDKIEDKILETIKNNKNKTYILGGEEVVSRDIKDKITNILQTKK